MTQPKTKPVWRMNTRECVPKELGGIILFTDGTKFPSEFYGTSGCDYLWVKDGSYGDIAAYQTTRTKAAKYR